MSVLPAFNALVASARILPAKRTFEPKYDSIQEQLWDYYDRLGPFESGVSWRANTMSRVRLLAAEVLPGGEEPIPIETGPAAEAMERLAGGTGGQAQLMKEITIHLSVPGEGWLVGETKETGEEEWIVASADELKLDMKTKQYKLREDEESRSWRPLPESSSLVVRFWKAHPRFGWRADSDARHALGAMNELDLINKRILAEIASRLTSNGILLYDKQKLSLPPLPEQPDDAETVDPFAAVLVDVASRGIQNPMSPEATIPIPIGFDLQDAADVDPKMLMQHIRLSEFLDTKLLDERESAVKQLATSLDMPSEVLLGMAALNHWGAWQVEESGIKIHISPFAEMICHALTVGFLVPTLEAQNQELRGPNGGRIVVWYDPSEITVRPDRSADTMAAYDRGEVPGRVLLREAGLSDSGDKMSPKEFREWLTRRVALADPIAAANLLEQLGGPDIGSSPEDEDAGSAGGGQEEPETEGERGLPETNEDAPPSQGEVASFVDRLDGTQVLAMFDALAARAERLRSRTGWVQAGVPNDTRVTPARRNGRAPDEVVVP